MIAAQAEIRLTSSFWAIARLGQPLDLLVLGLVHERRVDRQDVREVLAEARDALGHGRRVVGDVAQVALQLLVRAVLVEARRPAPSSMPCSGRVERWNSITSPDSS